MNSSYFDCPEEDVFVCDFEVDPIDFEVQEPTPFEKPDFQDIQFEENDGMINFDVDQENFNEDVSNYESESDEDSPQQQQLTQVVQQTLGFQEPVTPGQCKKQQRKVKETLQKKNIYCRNVRLKSGLNKKIRVWEWDVIAKFMEGRTVSQCKQHFGRINNHEKKKRLWTTAEDDIIRSFSINDSFNNWASIAQKLQGRTGKQVRERYLNQLRPEINKESWTEEEDRLLIEMQEKYGSKWSMIQKYFEGRSVLITQNQEIMLKNRFKKLSKSVDHYFEESKPKFNFPISQQSNTLSFI